MSLPQALHKLKKKVYYSGQIDLLLHQDYYFSW